MITEQEMKAALDGWFYSIDYEYGKIICKSVSVNHIPDHKPKIADIDDLVRVNGNARDWDDEQDDLIVQRRNEGVTFFNIGQELGVSDTAILKRYRIVCRKRGLKQAPRVVTRPNKIDPAKEAAVIRYRHDGKSFTDIAALVGLKRSQVYEVYRTYLARQRRMAA